MKYCLSPGDFPRAQAIFHRIPRLESQYSHSQLPLLANIFSYWLCELTIFSRTGFVSWPNTGLYTAEGVYGSVLGPLYWTNIFYKKSIFSYFIESLFQVDLISLKCLYIF